MKRSPEMGDLLEHAGWLRGLARALAHHEAEADDLVQDTWLAALRTPPDEARPLRPWLNQVLRNVSRMTARTAHRRRTREQGADEVGPGPVATAQDVLERAEVQRRLTDLVLNLDEPYRTAILLRYYEGRLAKDIAQALDLPAGTVRWRITEGLARLRAALLEDDGDVPRSRARLLSVAGPMVPTARGHRARAPFGTPPVAVATITIAVCAGLVVWSGRSGRISPGENAAIAQQRAHDTTTARSTSIDEEDDIMRMKMKHMAALFGTALPALVASAQTGGRELSRDEHIAFCVHRWERMAACREEFADYFSNKMPPDRRLAHRARFIEKATEAGTGPIEPRRQKCAEMVDRVQPTMTSAAVENVEQCLAKPTCQAVVACMKPIMDAGPPKAPGL